MIYCLAVSPAYRRIGAASVLMDEALKNLDRTKEISVSTFRADDEKGMVPRDLYEKYGFIAGALIEEFNYPNQKYILYPVGSERKNRQITINNMVKEIVSIIDDCKPSIYLYDTIRKYVQKTDRSLYSFGWLLDFDYAETLAEPIQRFADVLESEIERNVP